MHTVVIVNGLGGEITPLKWATRSWHRHGLHPVFHHINWKEKGGDFEEKLNLFLKKIDGLIAEGKTVSLVGCSAGGSAVMNAFIERKDAVSHVINICGPIRREGRGSFRSLNWIERVGPMVLRSIERAEKRLPNLSDADKKKIMTVHAEFGDELVPPETVIIPGATNIQTPVPEHIFAIYMSLACFNQRLIQFLKNN